MYRWCVAAFAMAVLIVGVMLTPAGPLQARGQSPDFGIWEHQSTLSEALDIVALDYNRAWASHTSGYVLRTTNGGQTWQQSNVGDILAVLHGIDMADGFTGWTVGESNNGGRVYKTTDGGATWRAQNPNSNRVFSVDALDTQTVMIVGGGTQATVAMRSTDGGTTWSNMVVPIPDSVFLDIFFVNSSTGWITGLDGGIAKSTDGGLTWFAQSAPFNYGLVSVSFSDPDHGWAGGYYQVLLRTTDGGQTWTMQDPGIPESTHVLAVSAVSPSVGWIAGYGAGPDSRPFVKYTTDGGATWIDHTPTVGPYDSFSALAFVDQGYGWAGGYAGIFRHSTGSPTVTPTPSPTAVAPTSTPTSTMVPPTATSTSTSTATSTATPSPTRTPGVTNTPVPPSPTNTVIATSTTTATATAAATGTATVPAPSPTSIPTTTPTACTISFTDVPTTHTFYPYIRCLACRGIIGGYSDGTFRPDNFVTRGQLSKIVANAAGFSEPVSGQSFVDVPPTHPFYVYIERMARRGIIGGYSDGTFRPDNAATRGQISKIVASAASIQDPIPPNRQSFVDVPPTHPFWVYIERLSARGIVGGYSDGTFRPDNAATRGQVSKIVANAFFPNCQMP
jgi:photosystem II stability/assembly factor-like uncharacterized protein/ribosomal protein L30/L7E